MPNYLKLSFVFIGTVIGAGFASGQEVYSFFVRYGEKSFIGTIIAGILFFLIFTCVMYQIYLYKVSSFDSYFASVKMKKTGKILSNLALMFMISSFFVMTSGCSALFKEQFNLPEPLGALLIAGVSFLIFSYDNNSIVKLNSVLTPLIIFGIIFMGIFAYSVSPKLPYCIDTTNYSFIFSSVVYVSYNTLTLIAITSALRHLITDGKTILLSSFITAFSLFILLIILWWIIVHFDFGNSELPVLKIAESLSIYLKYTYCPILYMAMLTTAVSNGGAAIHQLSQKLNLNRIFCAFMLCTPALLIYKTSFSFLVSRLYFLLGIAGIWAMIIVIYNSILSINIIKIKE